MADSYGHNAGSPESSPHSDNESGGHYRDHDASVREQDRFLPIANVSRIMKKALPSNAKISKDAKETVQECVSEFISFITGMCLMSKLGTRCLCARAGSEVDFECDECRGGVRQVPAGEEEDHQR